MRISLGMNFSAKLMYFEVKVSEDDAGTWHRLKISMVLGLEESGLQFGYLFQFNGGKYRVSARDDGLRVEPLKKAAGDKKSTKQKH